MSGGRPEIYEVKHLGSTLLEGTFGTRMKYGPFVIGDTTQARHMTHWWTIKTIAEKATDKIVRIWEMATVEIAKWLDGKG